MRTETKRKGARGAKDFPINILVHLNHGKIETANIIEWLAVDQRLLFDNLLVKHPRTHYLKPFFQKLTK